MTHENGSELPTRVSRVNYDVSYDEGSMQVNDLAHFGHDGWTVKGQVFDSEFNAAYSYQIFQRSGYDWSPWYSVCTVDQAPRYAGVKCE